MKNLTYIENKRIKEIIGWVNWLNTNLQYPNSESSKDELRYTEIFEEKVQEILDKKGWEPLSYIAILAVFCIMSYIDWKRKREKMQINTLVLYYKNGELLSYIAIFCFFCIMSYIDWRSNERNQRAETN